MKKTAEQEGELRLQLVEVTAPRARRAWLPGAQFAACQLDTRRWRHPVTDFDWQQRPSWHVRQRMN
jgi:hypothetical protein